MLGVGRLPPPSALPSTRRSVAVAVGFSYSLSVLSPIQTRRTRFVISRSCSRSSASQGRRRVPCPFAPKSSGGGGGELLSDDGEDFADLDVDDVDGEYEDDYLVDDEDDEYEDDYLIDDEDDDVEDESDDIVLGFDEMEGWLQRDPPKGFGQGKVYDTSVEDKLLEEIEKGRKAQVANMNKLKNRSDAVPGKSEVGKEQGFGASDIRVRISQLPKKKNIERDLNAAFKGVSGILNVLPVVSGNKKTKDPVCKGIAFVDFRTVEDANRFIRMFSSQSIAFGKVEKQIKCELLDSSSIERLNERNKDANVREISPRLPLLPIEEEEEDLKDWVVSDDEYHEGSDSTGLSSLKPKSSARLSLPRQEDDDEEPRAAKTKPAKKKKTNKVAAAAAAKVPKAGKRLKVREKAVLADVFSRYGSKAASASKER